MGALQAGSVGMSGPGYGPTAGLGAKEESLEGLFEVFEARRGAEEAAVGGVAARGGGSTGGEMARGVRFEARTGGGVAGGGNGRGQRDERADLSPFAALSAPHWSQQGLHGRDHAQTLQGLGAGQRHASAPVPHYDRHEYNGDWGYSHTATVSHVAGTGADPMQGAPSPAQRSTGSLPWGQGHASPPSHPQDQAHSPQAHPQQLHGAQGMRLGPGGPSNALGSSHLAQGGPSSQLGGGGGTGQLAPGGSSNGPYPGLYAQGGPLDRAGGGGAGYLAPGGVHLAPGGPSDALGSGEHMLRTTRSAPIQPRLSAEPALGHASSLGLSHPGTITSGIPDDLQPYAASTGIACEGVGALPRGSGSMGHQALDQMPGIVQAAHGGSGATASLASQAAEDRIAPVNIVLSRANARYDTTPG